MNAAAIVITAALGLGAAPAWSQTPESQPMPQGAVGQTIPNLCFVDEADAPYCLTRWRGRVVLLNLWATWCVPCRKEMPQLDRLQALFGGQEFEVIALSLDKRGAPAVMNYYERNKLQHLAVYVDTQLRANEALASRAIPLSLLIDREGRIVERIRGAIDWDAPARVESVRRLVRP